MKVVIIGGVAGGATAAARLRRLDEKAEIIVLERSGFVSYANCGLPYYIGGVIEEKSALTLQSPESFQSRFRIEVRVRNEAVRIDPAAKTVLVRRLDDGTEYTENYDKLLLSPGAKAVRPNLPGVENPRVFTLRTVEDTFRIREYIEQQKPESAIIIGGGFIGLEMAENLFRAGIETTILQRSNQVMPPLDYDMACLVHNYIRKKGIRLLTRQAIAGFEDERGKIVVKKKDGSREKADMVILSVGVVPETHLAKEAGLALGAKESILVNDRMETSVPDIYAVGDAVEVKHFVTGEKTLLALAGPANKQGRIAADNICGRESTFCGSQGSSVLKLFDMTIASTGINEKTAKAENLPHDKAITFSASHATYYPGASDMTVKTLYNPETGKILGAQIVGFEGVDKRIDVLATAIHAGMTAADLAELDLAYAPPFSSAKDPINMAGFVIENNLDGLVRSFHWHDVESLLNRKDCTLLDTRTQEEYRLGHIPGAVNIPLDELRGRLPELEKDKPIYVNCFSGLRSYIACRILAGNGYTCFNLAGGYHFYEQVMRGAAFDEEPRHPCGIKI